MLSGLGRDGKREVVLTGRLRPALQRLHPDLPVAAIEGALEELCRDRTALSLAEANREIDRHFKLAGAPLESLALAFHHFPQ